MFMLNWSLLNAYRHLQPETNTGSKPAEPRLMLASMLDLGARAAETIIQPNRSPFTLISNSKGDVLVAPKSCVTIHGQIIFGL
jgi:hypothetical protein